MIDRETVDRIYAAANIVDIIGEYVTLKRKGVNYQACCPFHNEKTPSFVVSPSKGVYKCFGCGKGGSVIQKIVAESGAKIDIEADGSIFLASEDIEACRAARQTIENIVFEPEVGELYYGKVSNIRSEFGAWVELAPGKDGLVKIKDLEFKRTEKVEDVLKIGDMTWGKGMNGDDRGRIDLSRKDAMREKGLM